MNEVIAGLLGFQGRLTRRAYWRWYLALVVTTVALWVAMIFFAMGGVEWAAFGLLSLMALSVYVSIGVAVRRLHDRGKSGWWLLLFQGVPLALAGGPIVLDTQMEPDAAIVLLIAATAGALIGLALAIWGLVEIGFRRAQPGENRFGAPPF